MTSGKTILSRIVTDVAHASDCCDVRRCEFHDIPDCKPVTWNNRSLSLKKGQASRLANAVLQIWARMELGERGREALRGLLSNARRGASKLSKVNERDIIKMMSGNGEPLEIFDTLTNELGDEIEGKGDVWGVSERGLEKLARLMWYSRFMVDVDSGLGRGEPIDTVMLDSSTADAVKEMAKRMTRVCDEHGGVTDRRHRVIGPSGTKAISRWEYEVCSKEVVWMVSHTGNLANSRLSTAMVATYFFMLDDRMFEYSELIGTTAMGYIDPVAGKYLMLKFEHIDDESARNTMSCVNGFGDDRIDDLIGQHQKLINARAAKSSQTGVDAAGGTSKVKIPEHRARNRNKSKPGKMVLPDIGKLERFRRRHGKASLYSIIAGTVKQVGGGVIPMSYFIEGDIEPGNGDCLAEVPESQASGSKAAPYIVPLMVDCATPGNDGRSENLVRCIHGAENIDERGHTAVEAAGIGGLSAIEYLRKLINDARENQGDELELAKTCIKINRFSKYSTSEVEEEIEDIGKAVDVTEATEIANLYRTLQDGLSEIGCRMIRTGIECAPETSEYIATAKAAYLTDKALIRITFANSMPKSSAILCDAVTRHFGIEGKKFDSEITMAIINPRLKKVYVLDPGKISRVNSISKEVADVLCRRP